MSKLSKFKYPGDNYFYTLCDVCGRKLRAKDAIKVRDKYSTQNGLVVCKYDLDKTNPIAYNKTISKERGIRSPDLIRSEPADNFVFISSVAEIEAGDSSDPTGRSPSAPRHLTTGEVTVSSIELYWQGPDDPGSSPISGYKVERETPVGGGFSTVITNTNASATYYKDTGLSSGVVYNYRVSTVTNAGTSSASNEAHNTTS